AVRRARVEPAIFPVPSFAEPDAPARGEHGERGGESHRFSAISTTIQIALSPSSGWLPCAMPTPSESTLYSPTSALPSPPSRPQPGVTALPPRLNDEPNASSCLRAAGHSESRDLPAARPSASCCATAASGELFCAAG